MAALWRARLWIVLPVIIATGLAVLWLSSVTPLYRSTAKLLVENQETAYTRPAANVTERSLLDQESIRSQVQLILSADLSRKIIAQEGLDKLPEFNPASSASALARVLSLFGVTRDPARMTNDEKVLARYYENLSVFQVDQSRVIAIEFSSENPQVAARVANAIADGYIDMQKTAKRDATREASDWLSSQIGTLRTKVDEAEREVEDYRTKYGLFSTLRGSTEPVTLSSQQLSELTTQLALARAQQSEAQAKARLIREMLDSGGPIESSEVLNSPLIQGLVSQQVTLRAQIAELSTTLGPRHPRMQQLTAQLGDMRKQIRDEAVKYARAAENDAAVGAEREQDLLASIEALKVRAAQSNESEVELRALERDAKSERDLLESLLARYRDATARGNLDALPADARLISRAAPAVEPYYPKTLATLFAVLFGSIVLSCGIVITLELFRSVGEYPVNANLPTPVGGKPGTGPGAGPGSGPGSRRRTGRRDSDRAADDRSSGAGEPSGFSLEPVKLGLDGIRDRILLASSGEIAHTVLVTAVRHLGDEHEVAMRIARMTAALGRRVVVVDACFDTVDVLAEVAEPEEESTDKTERPHPGLSDLLAGAAPFEKVIQRDRFSRVHTITAGDVSDDPLALLGSERMETVLEALRLTYDVVFVLAPSVTGHDETNLLAGFADQALLLSVSENGEAAVGRAYLSLEEAGAELVDVVKVDEIDEDLGASAAA